jgi:hypothetical protein
LLGDEDVLRNATIREVSPAVFSSGSARSARRLYKATVQRSELVSIGSAVRRRVSARGKRVAED